MSKGFANWGEVLGDAVVATAILDRLLHHSHTLNIRGESYRLREKKRAGLFGRAPGRSPELWAEEKDSLFSGGAKEEA